MYFLGLTWLLYFLSGFSYNSSQLSPNRCLSHTQFELLPTGDDITVHERSNLIPLLKNVLHKYKQIQHFEYVEVNDYVCSEGKVCFANGFIDLTTVDTSPTNHTLLIDAFLILAESGDYCIISNKI